MRVITHNDKIIYSTNGVLVISGNPYDAELEYLYTTARGPFINTGIRATNSMRVEIKFRIDSASETWQSPFGGDVNNGQTPSTTDGTPTLNMSLYRSRVGNYGFAHSYGSNSSWGAIGVKWSTGWHTFVYDYPNHKVILDNKTVYFTAVSGSRIATYSLLLFTKWRNHFPTDPDFDWILSTKEDGSWNHFIGAVEYFKIYDNDVLIQDLIPVRSGTTGYMYDRISKQLLGNVGDGAFSLGPDKQ